jgi:hypothetical protein
MCLPWHNALYSDCSIPTPGRRWSTVLCWSAAHWLGSALHESSINTCVPLRMPRSGPLSEQQLPGQQTEEAVQALLRRSCAGLFIAQQMCWTCRHPVPDLFCLPFDASTDGHPSSTERAVQYSAQQASSVLGLQASCTASVALLLSCTATVSLPTVHATLLLSNCASYCLRSGLAVCCGAG